MKRQVQGGRAIVAIACGLLSVQAAAAPGDAQPENAAVEPEAAEGGITDIVVTAQKRSEKVQSVPITITAIPAETLKAADIRSTLDLTQVVPGLRANLQLSFFQPFIRGVGSTATQPGNESPVAVYVDGFYVASKSANTTELNNIERIEVLKGPQGTLFGRNATGGAINIITKAPSRDELEFASDVSYGRFADVIVNGYLTGPLTETLSASASIRYQDVGDGYQTNIITGSELGKAHNFAGMAKLRWDPSSAVSFTGSYTRTVRYTNDDEQIVPNAAVRPKGALTAGAIISYTPFVAATNTDPYFRLTEDRGILNGRADLGGVSLVSITGYDKGRTFSNVERDRTGAPLQINFSKSFAKEFTQELQLLSDNSGPFSWIAGAYYFNDREGSSPNTALANIPGMGTLADLASVFGRASSTYRETYVTQYTKSYAGFAEASLKLGERTKITAGARYTTESRRMIGSTVNVTAPPPGTAFVRNTLASVDLSAKFHKPTWKLSVDHHFNDQIMGYASYNRGFRSGSYNTTAIDPTQVPLLPEVVDAYELGMKSDLFNRKLRFNAAAFYYDYRDLQVSVRQPATGVVIQQNAGSAEIYGLDIDVAVNPLRGLTLSGGANFLHAQYKQFLNASTFAVDTVAGGGRNVTIPDAKGYQLNYAPRFSGNITVQYDLALANGGQLSFNGNYFHTSSVSRQVGNILNQEEIDAYGSLNASATYRLPDRNLFFRLWGRNLTNHKILGSTLDSFAYFYIVQKPITYGVTIGFCSKGNC